VSDALEIHPRLVEEAVWAAMRGRPEKKLFHAEREKAYSTPDPEARDLAFDAIHARWFRRLGLVRPLQVALAEQATIPAAVQRCRIAAVISDKDAGAELYVKGPEDRSLVIRICPQTLVHRERALEFLRRELMHVADILDPSFEYEPRLPRSPSGPSHDRLLQDRYGALWRSSVDGRLVRNGRLDARVRAARLGEFCRAFSCLGEKTQDCFDRIFTGPRPLHFVFVAMAMDPEVAFDVRRASPGHGRRCPLCGFPTTYFEPLPGKLPAEALQSIRSDFPAWRIQAGLCPQCADLYRARRLATAAAGALPGAASV